ADALAVLADRGPRSPTDGPVEQVHLALHGVVGRRLIALAQLAFELRAERRLHALLARGGRGLRRHPAALRAPRPRAEVPDRREQQDTRDQDPDAQQPGIAHSTLPCWFRRRRPGARLPQGPPTPAG